MFGFWTTKPTQKFVAIFTLLTMIIGFQTANIAFAAANNTISGTVTVPSGVQLSDLTISLTSNSSTVPATLDGSGNWSASNLEDGGWQVVGQSNVDSSLYATEYVYVFGGQSSPVTLRFYPIGSASGSVNAIPNNSTVQLSFSKNSCGLSCSNPISSFTSQTEFTVPKIEEGSWNVTATAFDQSSQEIVAKGSTS